MVIYRLGLPYYKEFDNFQFIGQINLSMKEIQPAGTGWLFCWVA